MITRIEPAAASQRGDLPDSIHAPQLTTVDARPALRPQMFPGSTVEQSLSISEGFEQQATGISRHHLDLGW